MGGRGRGSRRRDGLSCPNLMVYKYLKYGPKTNRNDFKLLGMSTEFLGPLFFLIIISGDFVRVSSGGSRISKMGGERQLRGEGPMVEIRITLDRPLLTAAFPSYSCRSCFISVYVFVVQLQNYVVMYLR